MWEKPSGKLSVGWANSTVPVIEGQQVTFTVPTECLPISTVHWKSYPDNSTGVAKFGESSPTGNRATGQPGVGGGTPLASGNTTLVSYSLRPTSKAKVTNIHSFQ